MTQLAALREFFFPGLCGLLTQQVSRLQGIDIPRTVFQTEKGTAAPETNLWGACARIPLVLHGDLAPQRSRLCWRL